MSYFMIAVGGKPDFTSIPQVEALPIAQAQAYLQRLVPKLVANGMESSIWFVHDGETGTSHNIVQTTLEQMQMESKPLSETNLGKVIKACEKAKASFRIWWADGEFEVARCTSMDAVISTIIKQVNSGADIGVRYDCGQPSDAPATTTGPVGVLG